MLGLAEYRALSAELQALAWAADMSLQRHVTKDTSKKQAIAYANQIADQWDEDYDILLSNGTLEVIQNAANYYNNQLNLGLDLNEAVTDIQAIQQTQIYFGMRTRQRLLMNRRRLRRQIVQTAQVGPDKLHGLFTEPVPFGAYVNTSRRLLLGTAVQAEQNTAKYFANKADIKFIRWVLSRQHRVQCECEVRAGAIDKEVVTHLDNHNLDIDPIGLYFVDQLPPPPHPNCQCEYNLVSEDGEERQGQPQDRVQRAFHIFKRLLQRIRSK